MAALGSDLQFHMRSLFIYNSCKPFIVVNSNITGIQGWGCLGQADISPGMWWSKLAMQSHFEKSAIDWNIAIYMQVNTYNKQHKHKCPFRNFPFFLIFPLSNSKMCHNSKSSDPPPVKPSLLMVQRTVIPIILPKLKNQDKNVCFLKPLSYRVNCTAMITDTLPLSIPNSCS